MKTVWSVILVCTLLFLVQPPDLEAQYVVRDGVFVAGGGIRSGSNVVYDCVGQGGIGVSSGGSYVVKTGFWYLAGLSSAVEVAVVSFAAEAVEEGVRLEWTLAEGKSFDGVNVYRVESSSGDVDGSADFVRITEAPLNGSSGSYIDDDALPGRKYIYRIGVIDGGSEKVSGEVRVTLAPKPLTLYQNYPNPFNPSTSIKYYLPTHSRVRLDIYDTSGRLVRNLVNESQEEGRYSVFWDGRNEHGRNVSSGLYFYRLISGKKSITRKLILLR